MLHVCARDEEVVSDGLVILGCLKEECVVKPLLSFLLN